MLLYMVVGSDALANATWAQHLSDRYGGNIFGSIKEALRRAAGAPHAFVVLPDVRAVPTRLPAGVRITAIAVRSIPPDELRLLFDCFSRWAVDPLRPTDGWPEFRGAYEIMQRIDGLFFVVRPPGAARPPPAAAPASAVPVGGPVVSGAPVVPVVPVVSDAPVVPAVPIVTVVPVVPAVPVVPDVPDIPDIPAVSAAASASLAGMPVPSAAPMFNDVPRWRPRLMPDPAPMRRGMPAGPMVVLRSASPAAKRPAIDPRA